MKKVGFILFLLLAFLFSTQPSFACSCSNLPPLSDFINDAHTIFSGKVIGSRDIDVMESYTKSDGSIEKYETKERLFKFSIIEIFKGKTEVKELEVNAGNIHTSCSQDYKIGRNYFVYADGETEKDLHAGLACSRTGYLENAEEDIYFVKKIIKGEPEPQVYGAVKTLVIDENTGEEKYILRSGIKVVISGEKKKFETITSDAGIYEFNNLPKGKYFLNFIPPKGMRDSSFLMTQFFYVSSNKKVIYGKEYEGYFSRQSDRELEKMPSYEYEIYNALFETRILHWDNQVSGKFVDINGKAIKYGSIELVPVKFPFVKIDYDSYSNKIYNSAYECFFKPPGNYLLAYELNSFLPNGKRERFFYPSTLNPSEAKVFTFTGDEKLNVDIIAPKTVKELKGKIYWDDKTTIKGDIRMFLTNSELDKSIEDKYLDFERVDGASEFSLQVFEGNEYWLHFSIWADSNKPDSKSNDGSEVKFNPIKLKIGKTDEVIEVLVPKPKNFKNL